MFPESVRGQASRLSGNSRLAMIPARPTKSGKTVRLAAGILDIAALFGRQKTASRLPRGNLSRGKKFSACFVALWPGAASVQQGVNSGQTGQGKGCLNQLPFSCFFSQAGKIEFAPCLIASNVLRFSAYSNFQFAGGQADAVQMWKPALQIGIPMGASMTSAFFRILAVPGYRGNNPCLCHESHGGAPAQ